jgi:hypothetical protein
VSSTKGRVQPGHGGGVCWQAKAEPIWLILERARENSLARECVEQGGGVRRLYEAKERAVALRL